MNEQTIRRPIQLRKREDPPVSQKPQAPHRPLCVVCGSREHAEHR